MSLIIDGVPLPQDSMEEGLEWLKLLLDDRQKQGCGISPIEPAAFAVEYRIIHPGGAAELVVLTDSLDLASGEGLIPGNSPPEKFV